MVQAAVDETVPRTAAAATPYGAVHPPPAPVAVRLHTPAGPERREGLLDERTVTVKRYGRFASDAKVKWDAVRVLDAMRRMGPAHDEHTRLKRWRQFGRIDPPW